MANNLLDRVEQRRLLELLFERDGDAFIFYRNRWSRGVRVTPEEREDYLSAPPFDLRRSFFRKVEGRAPVRPPRGGDILTLELLRTFSAYAIVVFLLFGGLAFLFALGQHRPIWRWLMISAGVMAFCMSAAIVIAKLPRRP